MGVPKPRHKLSEKDEVSRRAVCSVCGPVRISKTGPKTFGCANRIAATHKAWANANPSKAAENRSRQSEHLLFDRDSASGTASCAKCGTRVAMVQWSRGKICFNRFQELRPGAEPRGGGSCRECWLTDRTTTFLSGDGSCPRCTDPRAVSLGSSVRDAEYAVESVLDLDPGLLDELAAYGYRVSRNGDVGLPSGSESAVRGWRTLGSSLPWSRA